MCEGVYVFRSGIVDRGISSGFGPGSHRWRLDAENSLDLDGEGIECDSSEPKIGDFEQHATVFELVF